MFNAKKLFKDRLDEHFKLLNRYLRYIFNGHFMIAIMFLIVTLAVYYQNALRHLPDNFPAALIIASILTLVVIYNPLNFFLKEPDKVFLIVKENHMSAYFKSSLLYNYIFQLYIVVIAIAIVAPLYLKIYRQDLFLILVFIVLAFKAVQLFMSWRRIHFRHKSYKIWERLGNITLVFLMLYSFIHGSYHLYVALVLFIAFNYLFSIYYLKHSNFNWEKLIENDQHRLATFYRFVSMFVDVPMVSNRTKKRKMITKLFHRMSKFKYQYTYRFLFGLTFIRSNDYLSLFMRLTVLGLIVIYFIPNQVIQILIAIVFVYMTIFQLVPLYHQHRMNIWGDLYPVPIKFKKHDFLHLIRLLSVIQIMIFGLFFILWFEVISMMSVFIIGALFIYAFERFYIRKKIKY